MTVSKAMKDAYTLTSYFEKVYKAKYGDRPNVNKYSARYGFDAILTQMSVDECKELIDFYFANDNLKHRLEWFFYNYDKLIENKQQVDDDEARLKMMREQSKKRAEEWRKKVEDRTSGS